MAGPPVTDSTEHDKQLPPPTYIDSDLHFDLEQATASDHITNLRDLTKTDKHTIMLRWHYRLGHTPFPQLKQMAKYDLLDKRLATIQEFPFCPGCQFGKQTRRAWRHRSNKKLRRRRLRKARKPGDVISVDTMNSVSVPGLVAQLRGRATLARYNYATVFVDHFSSIDYVHLHEYNDAEAVVQAKSRFEQFAQSFNVRIKHYHCDNGIFADKTYKAACAASNQSISFCGVNAHHQSGIAEKRIRDLRDSARSMLLLAKHNWPDAISTHLWGFAMNYASTIRASTLREGEKRTPLQKFAQTPDPPSVHRFHTFGCPVYTLDPNLQSGNAQPNKWTDRSKIGIFLGFSREHASTVSLVLNPITGLTSPQFHVKHDDRFESTKYPIMKEAGKWQEVTQIHRVRKKKNQRAPILQRELPQQELSQRELHKINELEDPQIRVRIHRQRPSKDRKVLSLVKIRRPLYSPSRQGSRRIESPSSNKRSR